MRENIEKKRAVIGTYDWQNLFRSFDREFAEIKNTVDRHDKEIVETLKSLLEFLKKNETLLKALQEENECLMVDDPIGDELHRLN